MEGGRVEAGETVIVGVNRFTDASETLDVPAPDYSALEKAQVGSLKALRQSRDGKAVTTSLAALSDASKVKSSTPHLMPLIIDAVKARATVGEMPGNVTALDRDIRNLPAIDLGNEIRKRERRLRAAGRGCLEQIEQGDEKQPYDDPKGEILAEIVHAKGLSLRLRHRVRCASAGGAAPATDRMLHSLNNCKARRCQRFDRPK